MDIKSKLLFLFCLAVFSCFGIRGEETDKGMFVDVELSKTDVVKGEPVIGRVLLYVPSQLNLAYVKSLGQADFGDCDVRMVSGVEEAYFSSRQNIDGKQYNVVVVMENVLFPQKSGSITPRFPDLEAGVVTGMRTDAWGFPRGREVEKVNFYGLGKQKIKVKSLPKSAPADFNDVLGSFSLSSQLPPGDIVKGRECILIYTLEGTGSLEDFSFPDLSKLFPKSIEVKSVVPQERCFVDNNELRYEITYEVTFIPREPGQVKLPDVSICYYDTKTKSFKKTSGEGITLEVVEPKKREEPSVPVYI